MRKHEDVGSSTMTHTEYGVLVATGEESMLHVYQHSTHRTVDRAEQDAAALMLAEEWARGKWGSNTLPLPIVTIVKRQVTYTLGEWEPVS